MYPFIALDTESLILIGVEQALLPEKRMLFQPNLAKAVGSDYIQRRIEELRPIAHIFGHTHFAWDTVADGVRYVQWPLAYPQERQ